MPQITNKHTQIRQASAGLPRLSLFPPSATAATQPLPQTWSAKVRPASAAPRRCLHRLGAARSRGAAPCAHTPIKTGHGAAALAAALARQNETKRRNNKYEMKRNKQIQ